MSWVFNNGQELPVKQEGESCPRHWSQHLQKHSKVFKGQGAAWQDWRAWGHEGHDKSKSG